MKLLNVLKIFKQKNNQVSVEIKTPEPIRCVAQSIIDDLDSSNYNKWEIKNIDLRSGYKCFELKMKCKNYILNIGEYKTISGYRYCYIKGINEYEFNKEELLGITKKFDYFLNYKDNINREKKLKQDHIKLSKLFPECYNKK